MSAGRWYTVTEAAAELRVGRTTAFFLLRSGQLKSVLVSGRIRRVPAEAIAEYKARKAREAGLDLAAAV